MGLFKLFIVGAMLALGFQVFISLPGPQMSNRLVGWKDYGHFFTYKGHQIFYRDDKGLDPNGQVLFISHGFPTSSYDWVKVWPFLLDRFSRVIAVDYLGFGFSDKPLDHEYSLFEQADIAETLLNHLKVKRVHILGHDYGDTVVQELLYRFNTRPKERLEDEINIQSVCLSNGGILPETNFPTVVQKISVIPYFGPLVVPYLTNSFLFNKGLSKVFGPHTQPNDEELSDFYSMFVHNEGVKVSPLLLKYMEDRRYYRSRWVDKALKEANIPLHVIFGTADPVNPEDKFLPAFRKAVPKAGISVLKDEIGHYPQVEAPTQFVEAYFKFYDNLEPSIELEAPVKDIPVEAKKPPTPVKDVPVEAKKPPTPSSSPKTTTKQAETKTTAPPTKKNEPQQAKDAPQKATETKPKAAPKSPTPNAKQATTKTTEQNAKQTPPKPKSKEPEAKAEVKSKEQKQQSDQAKPDTSQKNTAQKQQQKVAPKV